MRYIALMIAVAFAVVFAPSIVTIVLGTSELAIYDIASNLSGINFVCWLILVGAIVVALFLLLRATVEHYL